MPCSTAGIGRSDGKAIAGSTRACVAARISRGTLSAAGGGRRIATTRASQPNCAAPASGVGTFGFQAGASNATRSPQRISTSRR